MTNKTMKFLENFHNREEDVEFIIKREKETLKEGDMYSIREWMEEEIFNMTGLSVSLQESFDLVEYPEGRYFAYLHSDTLAESNDEDGKKIEELGLSESDEDCTKAIKELLDITIHIKGIEREETASK